MRRTLSARERRLVAIGLLVLAIAIVHLAIVGPILSGFSERDARREALMTEYQRNTRAIAAIPRLRRAAERQRDGLTRFVQPGPNAAVANDRLRERLEQVVGEIGGEFQAADEAPAPPGWTGARATARLTQPQLVQLLARLRNEPPWLTAEALDIAADQAAVSGAPSPMNVTLAVALPLAPGIAPRAEDPNRATAPAPAAAPSVAR